MVGAEDWYDLPFGAKWPLFCTPGTDIVHCLTTVGEKSGMYGFAPHMIMHASIFYLGALFAIILRRLGYDWDKRSFETIWEVGNHFPNMIMCLPMGYMCSAAAVEYFINGDPVASWGETKDMRVIETAVWFGTYLITDGILGWIHNTMDKMMVVHHIIFLSMCATHFLPPCGPGFTGSAMMAQEMSTPFLNTFLLCRGFFGNNSAITQIAFIVFFILFFFYRVVFNSLVTVFYFQELYTEVTTGESGFDKSTPFAIFIAFLLLGGCAMQIYFFQILASKVYKLACKSKPAGSKPRKKSKPGSKSSEEKEDYGSKPREKKEHYE